MEAQGKYDDVKIRKIVIKHSSKGELACKRAFDAAEALGVEPEVIGRYADAMGLKLVACQLGLFGYRPEKKVVKAAGEVDPALADLIRANVVNDRLPCNAAFTIAGETGLGKMDVSSACETLGIRVKPCQLGAF